MGLSLVNFLYYLARLRTGEKFWGLMPKGKNEGHYLVSLGQAQFEWA